MQINQQAGQPVMDANALLEQMRLMRAQANSATGVPLVQQDVATSERVAKPDFADTLKNAVQTVNQLQKTAGQSADNFVTGKENDLVKVMVDGQKATVGFQALLQVRNRMVSAYQDILNMPI